MSELPLPATGYLRQPDLIGRPAITPEQAAANRASGKGPRRPHPGSRPLIPFGPATLWRRVKDGSFPAPVKLSPKVAAWRVEDVRAWMVRTSS